jgi:hypothetical protein
MEVGLCSIRLYSNFLRYPFNPTRKVLTKLGLWASITASILILP